MTLVPECFIEGKDDVVLIANIKMKGKTDYDFHFLPIKSLSLMFHIYCQSGLLKTQMNRSN